MRIMFLFRLRQVGLAQFISVSSDLEARCRSYVTYAADHCISRVNSLAQALERQGRRLLGDVQTECQRETTKLAEDTTNAEDRRLRSVGADEEERLRRFYEAEGKKEDRERCC